jgi:hypothetical protein
MNVLENTSFDNRAHDGVHAGAVAPGGENGDFHCEGGLPVGTGPREVIYGRRVMGVDGNYGGERARLDKEFISEYCGRETCV